MNEVLRRALVDVGLDELDVAADLSVDPKTVRRWMEGRVPRPRHRRALVALVGVDELDVWPELRDGRTVPPEVTAIHSHGWAVPGSVWASLLRSAERAVDVLDEPGSHRLEDEAYVGELRECLRRDVVVRILICLGAGTACSGEPVGLTSNLAELDVQARVHPSTAYHPMLRVDDQMLVHHRAQGIADERTPILHLRSGGEGRMYASYLEGFEQIWRSAEPFVRPDVTWP